MTDHKIVLIWDDSTGLRVAHLDLPRSGVVNKDTITFSAVQIFPDASGKFEGAPIDFEVRFTGPSNFSGNTGDTFKSVDAKPITKTVTQFGDFDFECLVEVLGMDGKTPRGGSTQHPGPRAT